MHKMWRGRMCPKCMYIFLRTYICILFLFSSTLKMSAWYEAEKTTGKVGWPEMAMESRMILH